MKIDSNEKWKVLALLAQKGDQEAYKTLLKALYPYVQSIIRQKVSDKMSTDDITQNCLYGVHRSLHTFSPDRPFKPWLHAIIRYKLADFFAEAAKNDSVQLTDELKDHLEKQQSSQPQESTNVLISALENLPEKLKTAVQLTKIDGLSYTEASAKEGITESTLRKRISRAYQAIEQAINNNNEF